MSTPFGPQLIGETEKNLVALLRRFLDGTGLTEPQWVTLRLAEANDGAGDLADVVADRAHFTDAPELVRTLTDRGLVADGRPTDAGREVLTTVLRTSARSTGHLWEGHAEADVAATTRVLNEIIARARAVLA